MSMLKILKKLPIDLGQKEVRYKAKGSYIALELAGEGKDKLALDAGCANGFWSEKLKEQNWKVTSIDRETDYLGALKHDLNNGIPYPNDTFDLVLSTAVIAYLQNPKAFVKEIRRVLKPEGKFIVTTPNMKFWLNVPLKLFGLSLRKIADQDQVNFFNYSEIKALFPNAQIYGYFPYALLKFKIKKLVGVLSPTFVIEGKKDSI